MESPFSPCSCPWCCHYRVTDMVHISKTSSMRVSSNTVKIIFVLFLLCSGGIVTVPVVAAITEGHTNTPNVSSQPGSITTQKLSPIPDSDCIKGNGRNCTCSVLSKCKKCSRFDMSKQVKACLYTGYKQLAYCSKKKMQKYLSCHYSADFNEERRFWGFEFIVLVIGIISRVIVYYRKKVIQTRVIRRIQRQINA